MQKKDRRSNMTYIALIIGCFLGFGASYALMGFILFKLHDNGNSKGRFYDFSKRHLSVLKRQDHIRESKSYSYYK